MSTRYFSGLAILALLLLSWGCPAKQQKVAKPSGGCAKDLDCKDQAAPYCVQAVCQMCAEQTHCGEGQTCQDNRCVEAAECNCAEGEICEQGTCVKQCEGDDCPEATEEVPEACRESAEKARQAVVHFDFNQHNLSPQARSTLDAHAACLKAIPKREVVFEGHCDERGTLEYNLALGDRRASTARDYLHRQGVAKQRMQTVSKGEEEPACTQSGESCWAQNRRVAILN